MKSPTSSLRFDLRPFLRLELDEAALDTVEWRDYGSGVELGKLAREGAAGLELYRVSAEAPKDAFARHRHHGACQRTL